MDLSSIVQPELSDSRGRPDPDCRELLTPESIAVVSDRVRRHSRTLAHARLDAGPSRMLGAGPTVAVGRGAVKAQGHGPF